MGSAKTVSPLRSVAVLPRKLDLSGEILLSQNAGLFEVLVRSLKNRRPAFVLLGTLDEVTNFFGVDQQPVLPIRITTTGLLVAFASSGGIEVVVHAALTADRGQLIQRLCVGTTIGRQAFTDLVPEILARDAHRITIKRITGHSMMPWGQSEQMLQAAISAALKPLENLYSRSCATGTPDFDYTSVLERFTRGHARRRDLSVGLTQLRQWDRAEVRPVTVHGDFWLDNLLISGERVSGIVDWDRARLNGCAAFDALHLGFMSYAMWAGVSAPDLLASLWTDQWPYPWLRFYSRVICDEFHVGPSDLQRIAILLWLSYFYYADQTPRPEWETKMIEPICRALAVSRTDVAVSWGPTRV